MVAHVPERSARLHLRLLRRRGVGAGPRPLRRGRADRRRADSAGRAEDRGRGAARRVCDRQSVSVRAHRRRRAGARRARRVGRGGPRAPRRLAGADAGASPAGPAGLGDESRSGRGRTRDRPPPARPRALRPVRQRLPDRRAPSRAGGRRRAGSRVARRRADDAGPDRRGGRRDVGAPRRRPAEAHGGGRGPRAPPRLGERTPGPTAGGRPPDMSGARAGVVARPKRTVVAAIPAPPLGWTSVRPVERPGSDPGTCPEPAPVPALVRGKDFGDSYNYAPPADDELVEAPVAERRETVEDGPVRRVDVMHRTYVWDGRQVEPATRLEQRTHEPFVRIRIDFDNPRNDQRVRVHVPLRKPADTTLSEGQFAIVQRGREPEGGYGEVALATYPASSFVAAGGVVVLLEHVTEYELLDGELALTVLRSTGLISRNDNRYREDPAGPSLPIPAAQLRGPWTFSFAYVPDIDDVLECTEAFRLRFLTAAGKSRGTELTQHAGPSIEGHGVVLTSLRPGCARLVNESPHRVDATFAGRSITFEPWQIQTAAHE